jgi:hypothetical protein
MLSLTFELTNYYIVGYDSECRSVDLNLSESEGTGICILRPVVLGDGSKY